MEVRLRIHLLGSPRVIIGDQCIKGFPTEKVKLLFTYLVLFRDDAHPRQALAGLLWSGSSDERARHSLSTALWRLRQWLDLVQVGEAPYLLLEDGHIAFNKASAHWVDVAEFEERIDWAYQMSAIAPDQAAASLEYAVGLYHGELLQGCYADWCLTERDRLHQLYLDALLQLMMYYERRGAYGAAIGFGQSIVKHDPLREEVHRELIKLYMLNQQSSEALLQYRRCRDSLRTELGIEPMPETQAVFRQALGAASTRGHHVPIATATHSVQDVARLIARIETALQHFDETRAELLEMLELLNAFMHHMQTPQCDGE